jgi:transcriptional regulator with XRE-family HTH domain
MDVPRLIRRRLAELGLDQKDLAAAAHVTESYISQLLARKKTPPAPGRTDIYEKLGRVLALPPGQLASLAASQRQLELRKKVSAAPGPLYRSCREFLLDKCVAARRLELQRIFERDAFGELERLVAQQLLALLPEHKRSFENFAPPVDVWDIDLPAFTIQATRSGVTRYFQFLETQPAATEPGFVAFRADRSLSGDATAAEIAHLGSLAFHTRRPTALFYYRELQNLRDPLHFTAG